MYILELIYFTLLTNFVELRRNIKYISFDQLFNIQHTFRKIYRSNKNATINKNGDFLITNVTIFQLKVEYKQIIAGSSIRN